MILIVTSSEALRKKFNENDVDMIMIKVKNRYQTAKLLDVPEGFGVKNLRKMIAEQYSDCEGIQIIGGPSIIPFCTQFNPVHGPYDPDKYIPTDNKYADFRDDDTLDVPIARLPDGNDVDLMLTQLSYSYEETIPGSFALGNWKRPYVQVIAQEIPRRPSQIFWSEPINLDKTDRDNKFPDESPGKEYVYILLHGSDDNTSKFWGEFRNGIGHGYPVAFKQDLASGRGIVFTGCCYGAHLTDTSEPDNSIALAYLKSGVKCFIGSTVIHYSTIGDETSYNGPLFHKLFWQNISQGQTPVNAFFQAKRNYSDRVKNWSSDRKLVGIKMLYAFVFYGCL